MESLGWRQRRGSSPAARRGARQRAGLTPVSASNILSCERETLHQTSSGRSNSLDADHGIYGYFDAAVEDAGADNVAGGAIVELRGDGNEAWVARKQEREAYLGFAGQRLGRALSRPALGQRYRSVQQRRKRLGRLMRCRS